MGTCAHVSWHTSLVQSQTAVELLWLGSLCASFSRLFGWAASPRKHCLNPPTPPRARAARVESRKGGRMPLTSARTMTRECQQYPAIMISMLGSRCLHAACLEGKSRVAIYGLGNIRDERLHRAFQAQPSTHGVQQMLFFNGWLLQCPRPRRSASRQVVSHPHHGVSQRSMPDSRGHREVVPRDDPSPEQAQTQGL